MPAEKECKTKRSEETSTQKKIARKQVGIAVMQGGQTPKERGNIIVALSRGQGYDRK